MQTIADYWTIHLKAAKSFEGVLTQDDVGVMMILLKQARLANSPRHRDSVVDTIGYAALLDRIHNFVPTTKNESVAEQLAKLNR